jgi:hypothetical protein
LTNSRGAKRLQKKWVALTRSSDSMIKAAHGARAHRQTCRCEKFPEVGAISGIAEYDEEE